MMCEMIVIVIGTICIAVNIKVLYQIVNITIVIRLCYHYSKEQKKEAENLIVY